MDFQSIVDSLYSPSCIVSIDRIPDGRYENIRIAAGNRKYADVLGLRMNPDASDKAMDADGNLVPGLPYTDYFQQTQNFEDLIVNAALRGDYLSADGAVAADG